MATAARFAADVSATASPELRVFVARNSRAIWNLRVKTWEPLVAAVEKSELRDPLDRGRMLFLAHELEQRIFGRPGVS
jgi:hypothetical protein